MIVGLLNPELFARRRLLTWHVKAIAIQQSPCQSCDLFLPSSGSSGSRSRVLVTHMANYRRKWRRWCELKACSHVAGVQMPYGCRVDSRGRGEKKSSIAELSSPLLSASMWQIRDYFLAGQYCPLTSFYYSTARIRVREEDAIFSS